LGFWLLVISLAFAVWHVMQRFATSEPKGALGLALYRVVVPGIFGAWFLAVWELVTVGFGVPQVLLPPPSLVGGAITESLGILAADFQQTVVRAVIPGFVIGNLAGFAAALAADRWAFLGRGLLPVGNLVSAIPIIGIAPIMVMWFGFDWQSKAAVVVIMSFFPMLVNTISGLRSTGAIELDLMRSIGANHWQTFVRVRFPTALPFIFNALKINSALALIGAIVAEFFWNADCRHWFPHFYRSRKDEYGNGLGFDRTGRGIRISFLWFTGNCGKAGHILASVVPQTVVKTPLTGMFN
jgi:NitT/TauT family transport system permease protein